MVGDIELGEAYLASLGKPWSLLIQQFRPCKLAKKDHLLPHQSVIKSIFFQQLTPHVGNIIFNRFKELFGGKFKDYLGSTYEVFQNKSLRIYKSLSSL